MASKSKNHVGEVELQFLTLPKELKIAIFKEFKVGVKPRGRPNLLQQMVKQGLPVDRVLVEMIYRMIVEGHSLDDIVKWLKRKHGFETVKSSIFNLIGQLKRKGLWNPLEEIATTQVRRKIRIYYEDREGNFYSDIDYVQSYIERKKHVMKRRVLYRHLSNLTEIVNFLRKLPHEWTEEDITRFLNHKYEYYKKLIREKVEKAKRGENGKTFYRTLSEKDMDDRARENVRDYLTTMRVFLQWIGRGDLAEKFSHREWKREYTVTDFLTVEEFIKLMKSDELTDLDKFIIKLHITVGCREGTGTETRSGLWGLQWSKINWDEKTIDVFESKTKGGVLWKGVYLELFFPNFIEELKYWYNRRIKDSDYILESLGVKKEYVRIKLARKIRKILGRYYRMHYNRKTHAVWLIQSDVPLELIAGKPSQAFFGVGWEDLNTLMKHYGAFAREKLMRELAKVHSTLTPLLTVR